MLSRLLILVVWRWKSFHGQVSEPASEISISSALEEFDPLSSPCVQMWYLFQMEPFRPFLAVPSVMPNKVGLLWASSHIGCMDFTFRSFLLEKVVMFYVYQF